MNIAIVILDSVRKDYWDRYAPRLKEMADAEIDHCRAVSSWSAPSHASMFTGQLPSEVGVHTYQKSYGDVNTEDTLFDIDHRKVGVSSNMYVNKYHGFDKFFDSFYNLYAAHPNPEGIHVGRWLNEHSGPLRYIEFVRDALTHDNTVATLKNGVSTKIDAVFEDLPFERPLDEGTRAINKRIQQEAGDEPWFMFANYMETHTPHRRSRFYDSSFTDAPRTWSSYDFDHWAATFKRLNGEDFTQSEVDNIRWFRELYAASIDYVDRTLSETIRDVRQQTDDETVFIVTSDHGENMFQADDEDVWGHSSSLSEGLLRVPFVVIGGPDWVSDPPKLFSQIDMPEFVSSLLGNGDWPERTCSRHELVGGGVGLPDERREFFDRAIRAVWDGEKVIWDSLGNGTSHDNLFPDSINEMKDREMSRESETDLDDTAKSRLEDLGYV